MSILLTFNPVSLKFLETIFLKIDNAVVCMLFYNVLRGRNKRSYAHIPYI